MIDDWGISCEIVLRWKSLDLTDDKARLAQVMTWCHLATVHYLRQCWPRSMAPFGVTGPWWLDTLRPERNCYHFGGNIFKFVYLTDNGWIEWDFSEIYSWVAIWWWVLTLVQVVWPEPVSPSDPWHHMVSLGRSALNNDNNDLKKSSYSAPCELKIDGWNK